MLRRIAAISSSSETVVVPHTHFRLRPRLLRISSASVTAVPLGASFFWVWCVSSIVTCRRAAYDGHARFDAFDDVAVGGLRSGEFDGDIDASEVIGVEVCRIVNVDNQGNSVAARDKDLFDLLAHLAVAHESDLHRI